jgi:hypothetical protein
VGSEESAIIVVSLDIAVSLPAVRDEAETKGAKMVKRWEGV